jgi:predicted secreted hydrolase
MKSRRWPLLGMALLLQQPQLVAQYRAALPGYRYQFPRDYFNHPDFQTEWWYYTGNVKARDGRRFGFELTFFRQAVSRAPSKSTIWDLRDLYLAHLALSDLNRRQFYHAERTNRAGPGLAGISASETRIWNGNWQVEWQGSEQKLLAVDEQFELHFSLRPEKPPIIHGKNGVSQKGHGPGRASHYVSLTRLLTSGQIKLARDRFDITGLTWMDHEFFTEQLQPDQVGWDWVGLQLDDKTELMLFRIRRGDGSADPYSSGTFVDADGVSIHLRDNDFIFQPGGETWKSHSTGALYPIRWSVSIPRFAMEIDLSTSLPNQELTSNGVRGPNYWEGAVTAKGRRGNAATTGTGYLEMTGYDRPFSIGLMSRTNE